jgi:hypothetical protein
MFQLKPITKESIPRALEKAERYRLLNEPSEAESICEDILQIEPDNQKALITLVLALTDQFQSGAGILHAQEVTQRIQGDYQKAYYSGIICERRGKALLDAGGPGSGYAVYDWLRDAMDWYEKAEKVRPTGNDDSILRWNTCARTIMQNHLEPRIEERTEFQLE